MSGISIFMYHQVGHFPPMKTHRASYCDVGRFRSHMRALRWFGVEVISMSAAAAALAGTAPMPRRAAVLTFDDGCANFLEHALPVLEEFGYPSTVYAIAGLVGGDASWLAADGHPTPPLMTWPQLREIADRGVEVGSHALHHVRLAQQPLDVQRRELAESRDLLQQRLGRAVPHACYPYGSHDLGTVRAAAEAGYATAVTCQRAAATPAFDPLALPRKAISYGDDVFGFLWKLYMKDAPKGEAVVRPEWTRQAGTAAG